MKIGIRLAWMAVSKEKHIPFLRSRGSFSDPESQRHQDAKAPSRWQMPQDAVTSRGQHKLIHTLCTISSRVANHYKKGVLFPFVVAFEVLKYN